jgi:hypothetical protein
MKLLSAAAGAVLLFQNLIYPNLHDASSSGLQVQCEKLGLVDLEFSGAGGSARVYKGTGSRRKDNGVLDTYAVKISRVAAKQSVEKESRILEVLEQNGVTNVEKFITSKCSFPSKSKLAILNAMDMKDDLGIQIYTAIYQPYLNPPEASSISQLETIPLQVQTTRDLIKSVIDILSCNVYITDLQFLVEKSSGIFLIIDLTEGGFLGESGAITDRDLYLVRSFLGEAISFVQESIACAKDPSTRLLLKEAAVEGVKQSLITRHLEPEVNQIVMQMMEEI